MPSATQLFLDSYKLAGFLGKRFGATAIIDIGCSAPDSLMSLTDFRRIGRAPENQIAKARSNAPKDDWIALDLTTTEDLSLDTADVTQSIVICAGTLENVSDPRRLMRNLAMLSRSALAMIIAVDQNTVRDEAAKERWTVEGFKDFLREYSIIPSFVGKTSTDQSFQKSAVLAVIDRFQSPTSRIVPTSFSPLALLQTYNDIDIAPQIIQKLLDDGIEVHARDNWSTDGTYEALIDMTKRNRSFTVLRFPSEGPTRYHDLVGLLRWKEDVATQHPDRWIITHDSDEVRCSPWSNISLRDGLYLADTSGFNAVDFTVLDFRPCDDRFNSGDDPENAFTHFEFGRRSGHVIQVKAWRQPVNDFDLVSSGGHNASFVDRKLFPYKFLFKHYPLRNSQQAYRKIFRERLPRYNPETLKHGWHIQYNHFKETDRFLWSSQGLVAFDEVTTREEYLVELISGIGIVR
jgi:hypothetical protein